MTEIRRTLSFLHKKYILRLRREAIKRIFKNVIMLSHLQTFF